MISIDSSRHDFVLTIAQQPQRARMCGFGDKDRRPITPPPCVRLRILEKVTGREVDITQLVISFYILTVDLWDEHAKVEHNLGIHPSSQMGNSSQAEPNHIQGVLTRNLIGNLATSASKLHDPEEELGIWFMLQDVRVRIGGKFRLKFKFVNLTTTNGALVTSGSAPVLSSVFSDAFSVFSAKRFPGMIESTDISRKFSNQSIKIPVRRPDP